MSKNISNNKATQSNETTPKSKSAFNCPEDYSPSSSIFKAYSNGFFPVAHKILFNAICKALDGKTEGISTVELQDMRTNEGIEEIDIPLLTMYYSIILASFQEKIKRGVDFRDAADMITRIYAPDFMRCLETLGKGSGANENNVSVIMSKTRTFHNIIGIHHIKRNGRPDKSYFPVMNFEGYDSKTNTISFFSPYLNYIVREIYSASIKYDKKGQPCLKRNGQPMLLPEQLVYY